MHDPSVTRALRYAHTRTHELSVCVYMYMAYSTLRLSSQLRARK